MSDDDKRAKKFGWWWRDMENVKRDNAYLRVRLKTRKHETMRAAWCYEAEKRLSGRYRFDAPFPKLTPDQIRDVVGIWGYDKMGPKGEVVFAFSASVGGAVMEKGPLYRPTFSLNLEASDTTLFNALAATLKEVRAQRGISPSRRGRKGSDDVVIPRDNTANTPLNTAQWYVPPFSLNLNYFNGSIFTALAPCLKKARVARKVEPSSKGRRPGVNPHENEAWSEIEAYDRGLAGDKLIRSGYMSDDAFASGLAGARSQKSEMVKKYIARTPSSCLPDEIESRFA